MTEEKPSRSGCGTSSGTRRRARSSSVGSQREGRRTEASRSPASRRSRGLLIWLGVAVLGCVMMGLYGLRVERKHAAHIEVLQERNHERGVKAVASVLWHDYKVNPAATRARYSGQILMVAGQVTAAMPMLGSDHLLLLRSGDGDKTMQASVTGDAAEIRRVSAAGSRVKLRCEALTDEAGEPSLRDCTLAS